MSNAIETLDVAVLPLADGRRLMLPLAALAEVRQIGDSTITDNGDLEWRELSVPMQNLDAVFGLPEPVPGKLRSVVVIKGLAETEQPFLAWSFCGTASYGRVSAEHLEAGNAEVDDLPGIALETLWREEKYLIPDLESVFAAA